MLKKRYHALLILQFTFAVVLPVCHLSGDVRDYFYPNENNCGITEEISEDARTLSPWTVAIFIQKNVRSPFCYFLTGTLVGPTTVMTTFGGSYGQPSFKKKSRIYHIPPPSNFLVVAGIPSTDLNDMDEFSQMAEVSYILPYNGNLSGSNEYHLVMFRLKTPFKLDTPYVKTICQLYGAIPALHDLGYEGRLIDIFSYSRNTEPSFISGFDGPIKYPGGHRTLARFLIGSYNDDNCLNTYKYYYRSPPDEIFCMIIDPAPQGNNSTCMSHGSLKFFKPSPRAAAVSDKRFFDPEPRYYSVGIVALIPRKDLGQCDKHTVYIAPSLISSYLDWVKLSIICNSTAYPCQDGKCVPMDQVCDGKVDCSSEDDEDPVYCKATNRCKENDAYQCGLEGKCIGVSEIGDGVKHCPSGSDEHPEVVQAKRIRQNKGNSDETIFCAPVKTPQGVIVTCSHPQLGEVDCSKSPAGTEIIMRCVKHYRPSSRTKQITMTCYDDKAWKPFRAFSCQPECGLVHKTKSDTTGHGALNTPKLFPWHGEILRETKDGRMEIICGASLLERNILITAAQCTTDANGLPYEPSDLKVVLNSSPVIIQPSDETKYMGLHDVKEIRRPKNYDRITLQSDIAIIKLKTLVTYTDSVRPICYLMHGFPQTPVPNSTGTVPTPINIRPGESMTSVKNLDFVVLPDGQCEAISSGSLCAKSSQGVCCSRIGGAGLVFPVESDKDMLSYVLKGVFQSKKNNVGCDQDSERIYRFSDLDYHSEWLLLHLQNITYTGV